MHSSHLKMLLLGEREVVTLCGMLLLEESQRAAQEGWQGGSSLPFPSPLCLAKKGWHSNRNFQSFPLMFEKIIDKT